MSPLTLFFSVTGPLAVVIFWCAWQLLKGIDHLAAAIRQQTEDMRAIRDGRL